MKSEYPCVEINLNFSLNFSQIYENSPFVTPMSNLLHFDKTKHFPILSDIIINKNT